jgi:uncharacterized protein YggU (UPF0235/DUF167 family)
MALEKYLRLKVHAEAKKEKLTAAGQDRFEVWVREPAEDGRANRAVLALLSAHLQVPAGRLWFVKGAHSPAKIIAVRSQ